MTLHISSADRGCNGKNHYENDKTPVQIKYPLHPKHSLRLAVMQKSHDEPRKCYCCDESLQELFYYCSACDYAMNIAFVEKPPVFSLDFPKWQKHTLALFPRQTPFTCSVCALTHTTCPFYICPPCDFAAHQRCFSLPRVIRISHHFHRISFTQSFGQGEWSCRVCRQKIDNDYGGYSCIKEGCSYAAHSKCATQKNVWDGKDLEDIPEENEEEVEPPFVRISDGVIAHFSHRHHHLRLDENMGRDYDVNKLCQGCVMPIYIGNFYSCMQCDYILHETCANLSRKIHHPIHPHILTLNRGSQGLLEHNVDPCSACPWMCKAGFFYECQEGGDKYSFRLHVQCAKISEPLLHKSHVHSLFLTSKPGEKRRCSVCKKARQSLTNETFNCIECGYFSLCFGCATLPQQVRYEHDDCYKLVISSS